MAVYRGEIMLILRLKCQSNLGKSRFCLKGGFTENTHGHDADA